MVGSHHFLKEAFCRTNITLGTEHELNGLSVFVHRAIKILTLLTDLDIGLINTT